MLAWPPVSTFALGAVGRLSLTMLRLNVTKACVRSFWSSLMLSTLTVRNTSVSRLSVTSSTRVLRSPLGRELDVDRHRWRWGVPLRPFRLVLQNRAQWLGLLHFPHVCPCAGHLPVSSWFNPHLVQLSSCLLGFLVPKSCTTSAVAGVACSWATCAFVAS